MAKLAVNGGRPLRTNKSYKWPEYDERELDALERVLRSGVWGIQGTGTEKFARRFAAYQQAGHGLCVSNGTISLEIILRALGIGRGDEVIVPPYTFIATVSAVIMVGATPVFTDIAEDTYNMDAGLIEEHITSQTKAVLPVHMGGRACDMDRISRIAVKHGIYVIEDCAHAHGSEWKHRRAGSIGDAGSFSFQSSKNLNSGEGGMIVTNDPDIYKKCWSVCNIGRDPGNTVWYEHPYIGTNARMTQFQAALLSVQLDRLDQQTAKRMDNAAYLTKRLGEIPCIKVLSEDERITRNAYHLYIFKYLRDMCKNIPRDRFIRALEAEGIPCLAGYTTALNRQPLFQSREFRRRTGSKIDYETLNLKSTETACSKEGMWITQDMLLAEKEDMDDIADAIIKVYENADELL